MSTLNDRSLVEVENLYRYGSVSESELTAYLRAWNAGRHFTQAVWADGAIRNFDPDSGAYRHLWAEYGVVA